MPLELIVAVVLTIGGFGALGIIVGVYAQSWDNQSFINNIVILPLIFLGGVFYSVSRLGTPGSRFPPQPALLRGRGGPLRLPWGGRRLPWLSLGVVGAITFALLARAQFFSTDTAQALTFRREFGDVPAEGADRGSPDPAAGVRIGHPVAAEQHLLVVERKPGDLPGDGQPFEDQFGLCAARGHRPSKPGFRSAR